MPTLVTADKKCSLYRRRAAGKADLFIASTPDSRKICNDPRVAGVKYTVALRQACTEVLKTMAAQKLLHLQETETVVFNILRGGLNFGLREALSNAYRWNRHGTAFISEQRARMQDNPENWYITENEYRKVYLPPVASVVLGDVVATGGSLRHAVRELWHSAAAQQAGLRSMVFFTIGGIAAETAIIAADEQCRKLFPDYEQTVLIYFEGVFKIAEETTPVQLKITGTDLLRRDSVLVPEFIASQYDDPAYPLERCAIYDAGSRAFWIPEYGADVRGYWRSCLRLARAGMTYRELLAERMPALDAKRFGKVDLVALCQRQLRRFDTAFGCHLNSAEAMIDDISDNA